MRHSKRTYVDAFVREAWWDCGAFVFCIAEEDRELLDRGHGDISSVVTRQEGLSSGQYEQLVVMSQ
jgi:hypothetical protein